MKKILFVDDEPRVLDGLRRLLRGMRNEWEMEFAAGGREALDMLKSKPFDVVVADMRMPGMDGYQLLSTVREVQPQAVRIILSGHSDKESILKSIGPVHQFLSKPCDAEVLKATVSRSLAMRDLLEDKSLVDVVSGIESLPSLPSLYLEVINEVNSTEGSLERVGELISKDVGMSAKILQLVNSSFFGLPTHVSSPLRAVNLLGLEIVKALILTIKIFSQFSQPDLPGSYSMSALWNHSMATGLLAKTIAKKQKQQQNIVEEAFMAGLLHDVGKLILLDKLPEKWRQILLVSKSDGCPFFMAEQQVLGTTHARVGAYLMGIWGLSAPIVEAIAFHHCPGGRSGEGFSTLAAVHLANGLEHMHCGNGDEKWGALDLEYLSGAGIADMIDGFQVPCNDLIPIGHSDG